MFFLFLILSTYQVGKAKNDKELLSPVVISLKWEDFVIQVEM